MSNTTNHSDAGVGDGTSPTPPRGVLCAGTTKYDRPCPNRPQTGKAVCWHHDVANAERRKRNAVAGGVATHSPATREIRELKTLIREVKEGTVLPGPASVVTQLSNVLLRAIETERKIRETEDLEERLAALEGGRNGSQRKAA